MLLRVSEQLDTVDVRPFEDADDEFFDRQAGVFEDATDAIAEAMMEVVIDDGEWEEDGDVTM